MRAIVIASQGDVPSERVSLAEWPDPGPPGPGMLLVRTLASALNHLDLWVVRGVPGLELSYPRVGGCDLCGEVEAVGPGVDAGWVGRRVILNAAVAVEPAPTPDGRPPAVTRYELIGEHRSPGTHADRVLVPASQVLDVGAADPARAAAFGLTFLTAYTMLVSRAGLRPGMTVLITGIGGGVSLAALSLCRWMACPAIVTSRHAWKLERARELGASGAVLDAGGDWSREVRGLTGRRGVDIAADSVGKATHLSCVKSLAPGGVYVTPGCTSGPDAVTDLARVFWNELRIVGSTMGGMAAFAEVAALFRAGLVGPLVDRIVPAASCAEAYAHLEGGGQMGKVVIDWRGGA